MAKRGSDKKPVILRVQTEERAHEVSSICEKHGWKYIIGIEPDKSENTSDLDRLLNSSKSGINNLKVGRNDPCSCDSGKKYKKCCIAKEDTGIKESAIGLIHKCGLCGKTTNLIKTPCCDQWICDDESNYKLFSYERNSCYRNHSRFTLCGNHYVNDHTGHWKDCEECKEEFETELYVYFGTNEYNFEKLKNPPKFKPTKCVKCGTRIHLGQEGYSVKAGKYWCARCTERDFMEKYSMSGNEI